MHIRIAGFHGLDRFQHIGISKELNIYSTKKNGTLDLKIKL